MSFQAGFAGSTRCVLWKVAAETKEQMQCSYLRDEASVEYLTRLMGAITGETPAMTTSSIEWTKRVGNLLKARTSTKKRSKKYTEA